MSTRGVRSRAHCCSRPSASHLATVGDEYDRIFLGGDLAGVCRAAGDRRSCGGVEEPRRVPGRDRVRADLARARGWSGDREDHALEGGARGGRGAVVPRACLSTDRVGGTAGVCRAGRSAGRGSRGCAGRASGARSGRRSRWRCCEESRKGQPSQRAVALGTLGVLRTLARESPTVLGIDDVQWLDRASESARSRSSPAA